MSVLNDQKYYFLRVHPSCKNHQEETIFVCLRTRFVEDFKTLVSYWLVDSLDFFKVEVKSYAYFE